MRVGVVEVLSLPSRSLGERAYHSLFSRQFASVTPQAVSVWCRQLGHETFYATYYGQGDVRRLVPEDLDVVFVSCVTHNSALGYALAKLYRRAGARTVIGGPHARAFPADCLRFFDFVVKECDKSLVADILDGHFDPGSYVSSAQPFEDLPPVEERMPEIRASALLFRKWRCLFTVIPTMTSMGCPYTCNFCIDWDNPYRLLSLDRFAEDLKYVARHFPKAMLGFWEPNFAVKFDRVFNVLESLPPESRVPYAMECSLSILNPSRIQRLKETNCRFFLCGIESWADYSDKAGIGKNKGSLEKFEQTFQDFEALRGNVPFIQGNFIFGLDCDRGEDPVSLTREFISCHPFVWTVINTPAPYGGTPLYEQLFREGRILQTMPFSFYYTPYLGITLKNYDVVSYYEKLIELSTSNSSAALLKRRMESAGEWQGKLAYKMRTMGEKGLEKVYRQIYGLLRSDSQFRAFHEGKQTDLPEVYHREYEDKLGPYAELLTRADRRPSLEPVAPEFVGRSPVPTRALR